MSTITIKALMEEALISQFGTALHTGSYSSALLMRRRLYAFREHQRRAGSNQFDGLSFIAKSSGEVLIVKREGKIEKSYPFSTRPLESHECPERLIARGKRKQGLISEAIFESLRKGAGIELPGEKS
jgi:hypothetical protein